MKTNNIWTHAAVNHDAGNGIANNTMNTTMTNFALNATTGSTNFTGNTD